METILIGTSVATSAIFLTIFLFLVKDIRTRAFNSKEVPLIILALAYLIFTIVLALWSLGTLDFNSPDLLIVLSIILIIQAACLLAILYEINQSKKIFYTLLPLLFLIPLGIFTPRFLHIAIPISLFITLYAFLSGTSIRETPTKYLILYTSISLLLYILTTLWQNLAPTLVLISTILFTIFIFSFLKSLNFHTHKRFHLSKKPESPLIHFLKHFIFIIIITNFIFIGTVSIHELGHLAASTQSNCEEARIVYELKGLPHTEISCSELKDKNLWILAGVLLPFIISLFLFFGGGKFIKEIALQITGFNLIISYLDITSLNIPEAIATFILITGIAIVAFSLGLLAKSRIE